MITLSLMRRAGRSNWECQWTDPITGRKKTRSTGNANRREAERFLGALEHKLNTNQLDEQRNSTWESVADRYETEVLDSLALKTKNKFKTVRNAVEEIISPKLAKSLDSSQVSKFQSKLREKGNKEATIKSQLSALRACLHWAHETDLIPKVPIFKMPRRTAKMKGRPITTEEFERMVEAIPKVVPNKEYQPCWKFFLEGLWPSTLRLDEALRLSWDRSEGFSVDLAGKHPRFRIEVLHDKSRKFRSLPMTPDLAAFLLKVPANERRGRVFRPKLPGQQTIEIRMDTCSKVISAIGEKAQVFVAEYPPKKGKTEPTKKWASAHDFRRSCLTYWSKRLKPIHLKDLARHKHIETTMTFYVGEDFDDTEAAIWSFEGPLANSLANSPEPNPTETEENAEKT